MKKDNNQKFTYQVLDFNDIVKDKELFARLRQLTLKPYSGMNNELTAIVNRAKDRKVKAKAIIAIDSNRQCSDCKLENENIVAWAILSSEKSNYYFQTQRYKPEFGKLFQVFVSSSFRRKGIGSNLIKIARKHCGRSKICICPWDNRSKGFFEKFSYYQHEKL